MINAGLYCRHGRARGQAGKFWHQRPLSGLTWIIISPFPPPLSSSSMQCRLREDLVYNLGWILGNFLNWADPKPFQNLNFVKKSAINFFDEINFEPHTFWDSQRKNKISRNIWSWLIPLVISDSVRYIEIHSVKWLPLNIVLYARWLRFKPWRRPIS